MLLQFPVVAVDGEQAILNPFSGRTCGHLRVLLALGSHAQIAHLQNAQVSAGATAEWV